MRIPNSRILPLWVLLPLLLGSLSPAGAACDNCPQRRITLYDFDVTAPRPDSVSGLAAWYPLFFAGPAAGAKIFTTQCASFIDASFYRDSTGIPSQSLTVGIDRPHTAPAGNLKGMDYLLKGSVSPDGAGFKVDMSLECACNRKTVKSASARFARPEDASAAAADLAAREFTPIAEKLRQFERDERGRDKDVSLGGYNVTLTAVPQRRKVAMGEKVPVTLSLVDCDGEPLAGRTLSLTAGGDARAKPSHNGSFAVSEATTGADGKVTVEFTAGSTRGPALARAYFFHRTPFGCEAAAMDEAALEVDGSTAYYQLRYAYEEYWTHDFLLEEKPMPTWTRTKHTVNAKRTLFSGSAVLRNIAFQQGDGVVELEGEGLSGGLMNGSHLATSHTHSKENYSDDIATIRRGGFEQWRTDGAPAPSGAERQDIYISLLPDELQESSQFSLGLPFAMGTFAYGNSFETVTSKAGTFDTSSSFEKSESDTTLLSPALEMKLLFSLKDSVFHIDGVLDTSWEDEEDRIHLTSRLNATVTPIAAAPKSNGLIRNAAVAGRPNRFRVLNGGAAIACRMQDIAPGARLRLTLHTLDGKLLSVLHDGPRIPGREMTFTLPDGPLAAPAGMSLIVLRAGSLRETRILPRNLD